MRLTANRIAGMLRQKGYKLTPQRHAILDVIAHSNDHLTPEAIHKLVIGKNPDIGLVTVYRTLNILTSLGLVCKLHGDGDCRTYLMRRPAEHHHHLVCSACGKVVDFTDCDLFNLEQKLAKQSGFEIQSHLLEFRGTCRTCRAVPT